MPSCLPPVSYADSLQLAALNFDPTLGGEINHRYHRHLCLIELKAIKAKLIQEVAL